MLPRRVRFPLLLLVPLVFAACATEAPRVHLISFYPNTPERLSASVVDGRAPAMHAGAGFSYWLWRDTDGIWHLRTTSRGRRHLFEGRIHADSPGALSLVTTISQETSGPDADQVGLVDGDLAFALRTKDKQDGFDFRVARDTCLEIELRIDGDGDPAKINLGAAQTKPTKSHFLLCP